MTSIKAAAPMTEGAQRTARRWLEAELERAEHLTLMVSGQGEHAEILATLLAMLEKAEYLAQAAGRTMHDHGGPQNFLDLNAAVAAFRGSRNVGQQLDEKQ